MEFAPHLHANFLFQWEALRTRLDEGQIDGFITGVRAVRKKEESDGNKTVDLTTAVVRHIITRHVCRASFSPLVEGDSRDLVAPNVFKCRFVFVPCLKIKLLQKIME
jgi:hypothetical protein